MGSVNQKCKPLLRHLALFAFAVALLTNGRPHSIYGLSGTRRACVRILHHKTDAVVLYPLQGGDITLLYGDAEEVLVELSQFWIPMILHETGKRTEHGQSKPTKLYSESGMAKLIRRHAAARRNRAHGIVSGRATPTDPGLAEEVEKRD